MLFADSLLRLQYKLFSVKCIMYLEHVENPIVVSEMFYLTTCKADVENFLLEKNDTLEEYHWKQELKYNTIFEITELPHKVI